MKQKLLLMMLVLGMCSISVAQINKELQVGDDGFKWYKTSNDGKEGAEDMNGNTIVPCEYWMISYEGTQYDFYPKWFKVSFEEDSEWFRGAYTVNGRYIIPTSRHYTHIIGWIHDDFTHYNFEKKGIGCGVCDVNGREVIFIEGINSIQPKYDNGKFYFTIYKNDLWGIADGNGKIIIQPKYKNSVFASGDNFVSKDMETGEFVIVGDLASVTTTHNPLDVQEEFSSSNNYYASSNSSSSSTPSVKELFNLAYNTPDSEAQLQYDRYQKVLQADPNNIYGYNAYVYNNLGCLYDNLGDKHKAKAYFESALAVDPKYENAKNNLKKVKREIRNAKLDRISDALSAFGEALGGGQAEETYNSYQGGSYVGSSGSYSNESSGSYSSSSSSTIIKKCRFCAGSGRCSGMHRCRGTGKCNYCNGQKITSTNGHYHECGGCHGTGKCSFCGGTGKCKHCGGTGKG